LQLKCDHLYHFISEFQCNNIRKKTNILGRSKGENMPRQQILTPAEYAEFETPQVQRFKLTLLKKISQSTRPSKIFETLSDWQILKSLSHQLTDVISELDLTYEGLRYYANSVLKSRAFQMSQRAEVDRHLHLVCFIAHQFYRLQDTLIDILLTVVQNALNTCQRVHKEQYYALRQEQRSQVHDFVEQVDSGAITPMKAIETIAFSEAMSDTEKVKSIQDVLTDNKTQRDAACQKLNDMKMQAQRDVTDADYYQVLASQSSDLLCGDHRLWLLDWNAENGDHFRGHNGVRIGNDGQRILHPRQYSRSGKPAYSASS
jgi:hypothetical protein